MKLVKTSLIIIFISALLILPVLSQESQPKLIKARVTKVVDGDTIDIRLFNGNKNTVRYIGIDTPETAHPYRSAECYGYKASYYNAALVSERTVWLEFDEKREDQDGRLLAYVYLDPTGKAMVNLILLAQGLGELNELWEIAPNTRYLDLLKEVQTEAKKVKRGFWSECFTDSSVKISRMLPNPKNEPEEEWIEICNGGNERQNISKWSITDKEGEYFISPSKPLFLEPKECHTIRGIEYNPTGNHRMLFLRNKGDQVHLRNELDKEVHRCKYGETKEGMIIKC